MKSEEFTIKSQHDGLELGASLRIPDHPVGILQLVHGMAEHRERYHNFMDYCAQQGFIVMIHDHRGHGASVKSETDYGYFYQDGMHGIIEDVHQVTLYLRERFPGLPLTLFGHSMGSLVVRCYTKKYDADIDQLIVCGSPSKRFGAGAGRLAVKLLKILKDERYRSSLVQKISFAGYNEKSAQLARQNGETVSLAEHYPSASSWIVSDPEIVAAYDTDARDGFVFTLNGFETLFGLMKASYSKSGWKVAHPELPIFFIAGANDPCIISPKDFQKAVDFMRARGYHNTKSKLYPGMRHEILNERNKMQVWRDITEFISQTVLK